MAEVELNGDSVLKLFGWALFILGAVLITMGLFNYSEIRFSGTLNPENLLGLGDVFTRFILGSLFSIVGSLSIIAGKLK